MSLNNVEIQVNEQMVGAKQAVVLNGIVVVSPAMWDLIVHASPEELERLLSQIKLLNLGTIPGLDF